MDKDAIGTAAICATLFAVAGGIGAMAATHFSPLGAAAAILAASVLGGAAVVVAVLRA